MMNLDIQISDNFNLKELVHSNTADAEGIHEQYEPELDVIDNLTALVNKVLQLLRDLYGKPIHVNCGYRCTRLNAAVGGVKTSQHLYGQAADCSCENNKELIEVLMKSDIDFDQCISEKGSAERPAWVHISYKKVGTNRKQFLRIA